MLRAIRSKASGSLQRGMGAATLKCGIRDQLGAGTVHERATRCASSERI